MPVETNRKRSVRRIYAPDAKKGDKDKDFISLKITDEISFEDERPPYQEWVLKFQNSPDAGRETKIVEVGENQPKGEKLRVERVISLETSEEQGIQQEAIWAFLGNKESPPLHLDTYKRKIYLSDASGNITDRDTWIEVERIRSIEFEDPADDPSGQEHVWKLKHPDEEDQKDDYPGHQGATTRWDFTDINPPYRLDPFQMIVDCSWNTRYMLVLHSGKKITAIRIPTKKIDNFRGFKVAYARSLTHSSWGTESYPSCQLKPNKKYSVIMSHLQWDDRTISAKEYHQIYCSDNLSGPTQSHLKKMYPPTMAIEGTKGHAPLDDFTISAVSERGIQKHKIQLTGQPDEKTFLPVWVSVKGDRYYIPVHMMETSQFYAGFYLPQFYTMYSHQDESFAVYGVPDVEARNIFQQWTEYDNNGSIYSWPYNARHQAATAILGSGEDYDAFAFGYAKNNEWVGAISQNVYSHGRVFENPMRNTYSMPFPELTQASGVDKLSSRDVSFKYTVDYDYFTYYIDRFNTYWMSNGITYYYDLPWDVVTDRNFLFEIDGAPGIDLHDSYTYYAANDSIYVGGPIDDIHQSVFEDTYIKRIKTLSILPFPYGIKGKSYTVRGELRTVDGSVNYPPDTPCTLITPSGSTLTIDSPYLIPWFHASDGYNIMQGIGLSATASNGYLNSAKSWLFLNGKDVTSEIEGIIGAPAKDIQAVFLDIRMSDIKKLK
jgi:hypothetical protein